MVWTNARLIFRLEPHGCRSTHSQVPTPWVMPDGNIRVYYACRDTHNQSYPAYFDLSKDLETVLKVHETSIMERGKHGMFDSDGIMPSCVIQRGEELWLYFIGWNARAKGARYQNEIGIAVSRDGGETFERMFDGPIVGRSPTEPGLAVMPFVMKDDATWRMWYQSGTSWELIHNQYEPVYVIKHAASLDGIRWERNSEVCIEPSYPLEAFSRPCVIKRDGIYKAWYCYRDSREYRGGDGSYKIGYAESDDGILFKRLPDQSIPREDWNSKMLCYPYVFEFNGKLLMLYNGNLFGQTGIGLCEWI